jgi:hypothetical protein
MAFDKTSDDAAEARMLEQQRQERIRAGTTGINTTFSNSFGEPFFEGRKQAYINYASPQVDDQHAAAQKELTFALTRAGLLDSSVRAEKLGDLQKRYDLTKQEVADRALEYGTDSRNAVEDARGNLVATLNATSDNQAAAQDAITRANALSKPPAFSPLTNLFADFTAGLGTQAALEKANYYSGGQTPVRYKTGLFSPKSGAVKVT